MSRRPPAKVTRLSQSTRREGARVRKAHGLFNKYVRALNGPRADKIRQRIAEIDAMLTRGTRMKGSPIWEGGQRVGTAEKELPLLPSERALSMARRNRLRANLERLAPDALRQRFIEMLPDYAERHELTREILLAVGVPARDLDDAGITE